MTRLHGRIKHGRILNSVKLIVRFTSIKGSPQKYGLVGGEILSFLTTGMTKWVWALKNTPLIKKNKVR